MARLILTDLEIELETELAAAKKAKKDAIKEKEPSKKSTAAKDNAWGVPTWDDAAFPDTWW